MFSLRALFPNKSRPSAKPAPRQQPSRSSFRPRLECLEDRTLLNARFVVAAGAPVDNITNFATLGAALTTPGLASGDTITIKAGSAPGQLSAGELGGVGVTNLTIQGDPTILSSAVPQFTITTPNSINDPIRS